MVLNVIIADIYLSSRDGDDFAVKVKVNLKLYSDHSTMEPSLALLLESFSTPSDAQRDRLMLRVEQSEAEILQLTKVIDDLTRKRDVIQRHLASYLAMLAPVRKVPYDVLRQIFVYCLPSKRTIISPAPEHAPVLLTHVCRTWRDIAFSSGELWASFGIQIPLPWRRKDQLRWAFAPTWLSRSSGYPLVISISAMISASPSSTEWSYPTNDTPCKSSLPHELVQSLIQHSHKWKNLSIFAPPEWIEPFSTLSKTQVPGLQQLSLCEMPHEHDSWHPLWQSLTSGILSADRLRNVELTVARFHNDSATGPLLVTALQTALPSKNLIRLHLNGWGGGIYDAWVFLKSTPLLECASISVARSNASTAISTAPADFSDSLILLHLFSFTFSECRSSDITQMFFSKLVCPQLKYLTYYDYAPEPASAPWLLMSMSSYPLENLSIPSLSDEVARYLRSNTRIKCLQLGKHVKELPRQSTIGRLLPRGSDTLCPHLEILDIHTSFNWEIMIDVVKARTSFTSSDGITHFKQARVNCRSHLHREVLTELRALNLSTLNVNYYQTTQRMLHWPTKLEPLVWPE